MVIESKWTTYQQVVITKLDSGVIEVPLTKYFIGFLTQFLPGLFLTFGNVFSKLVLIYIPSSLMFFQQNGV